MAYRNRRHALVGATWLEVVFILLLVGLCVGMVALPILALSRNPDPKPEPGPVTVPVGAGVESVGDRIIEVLSTEDTKQSLVDVVARWCVEHPDFQIEVLVPADYVGGGGDRLRVYSYLLVGVRKVDR